MAGEGSANKLIRIASVATIDNQQELAEKVKLLPQKALEIFVREERMGAYVDGGCGKGDAGFGKNGCDSGTSNNGRGQTGDAFPKPLFEAKCLRAQTLKLDDDVENELMEMQEKGIDVNKFLRECLKRRKEEIDLEKAKIAEEEARRASEDGIARKGMVKQVERVGGEAQKKTQIARKGAVGEKGETASGKKISRYVPAKIRYLIQKEYGNKCSMPNCHRPAKILHHALRFAMSGRHDPRYLAPLCEGHHWLAHLMDLKYQEKMCGWRSIGEGSGMRG